MKFTNVEHCKLANIQYLNQLAIILYDLPDVEILSHCLTKLCIKNCPLSNSMNLMAHFGNVEKLSEMRIIESPVQSIESLATFNTYSGSTNLSVLRCLKFFLVEAWKELEMLLLS